MYNNNNFNNDGFNNDFLVVGQLEKQNKLKSQELAEKEAMRRAYCKANDIPFEELENQSPGPLQGSLKVVVLLAWCFTVLVLLSILISKGSNLL